MAAYVRLNALDQALDIAGSLSQGDTRTLADEPAGLGKANANTATTAVTFVGPDGSNLMTLSGLTGGTFSTASEGNFLSVSGAGLSAGNVGTFLIVTYVSATSVKVLNASGVAEGPISDVLWQERAPYVLEDDINFARTDRRLVKGTTNWYDAVPTYERPSAVGTSVPANLTNIAGKTTDAKALVVNRKFEDATVAVTNTLVTLTDTGNMKHADATDRRGIPIQDGADAGADLATYVEVIYPEREAALEVLGVAVGDITVVAGSLLVDGDYFAIGDGTNTVTFEYNTGAVTPGNIKIAYTSGDTATQVRDATISVINAQGSGLRVTAVAATAAKLNLSNDIPGTAGNVAITENVSDAGFLVNGMSGGTAYGGWRIYGRTQAGSSTSPNSVEVAFRAVEPGKALSTSVAYTWERGQPTTVDMYYGYRMRLDEMTETALRTVLTNGIVGDADMEEAIKDIRSTLGISLDVQNLFGLLTNVGSYYCFVNLGNQSAPTVVDALNTLNAQIGNRDYTGSVLTDGQTIAASLQALSNAVSASSIERMIERRTSSIAAGTTHTLPNAKTYTLDGTGNGLNLWVFWRGVLRDPGLVSGGNDYSETSTTQITVHSKINSGDHINYFMLQ